MESKNKKEQILYGICILISILLFINIFAPWLFYQGKSYTILGFYRAVKINGGLSQIDNGSGSAYITYGTLFMPFVAGILSGLKTILLIFKGRIKILSYFIYGLDCIYICILFLFAGGLPTVFAMASILLILVDFLINKYLEEYKEFTKKSRELRIKEMREKEERKRRLSFPGKYSAYYYRMILKDIIYHKWEYLLLIAGGAVSVTFLFTMMTVQDMMNGIHSEERFLLGSGMQAIMKEAVMVAVVINMVIMGFSLSYFVKKKLSQEEIMSLLGTRSSRLKYDWILEYGICLFFAVIAGCICGGLNSVGFRWIVGKFLRADIVQGNAVKICFQTILIFLVISLVSLAVNYEVYTWEKYSASIQVKKEKIPKMRGILVGTVLGIVFIGTACFCYRQRRFAESMIYIFLFLMGAALILIYLTAAWVRRKQTKVGRSRHILETISFTYHFRGSTRTLAILFAIHFLILSVYTMQLGGLLSAPPPQELYPYDFVCMAYPDDSSFFESLEDESVMIESYPMIRVTSVEGDAFDLSDAANNNFLHVLWPQGQHIGIAESTYIELQRKLGNKVYEPHLSGEEIFIVYQQDSSFKAHPLDWYLFRNKPYLRIGQPLRDYYYLDRENLYPPRDVKGEKIQILTGMFDRGMQEDIVVFSDEYFYSLTPEGPTEYYLLRVNSETYSTVSEKMEEFAEVHKEDSSWDENIQPYYEKRQMVRNTESERTLKLVVNVFELLMLTVCSILIASLKFISEREERKERHQLLFKIGMYEKERKKLLRKELYPFFIIPIGSAGVSAVWFTAAMFQLRMYTTLQRIGYIKYAAIIWTVYFIVQFVFYQAIKRKLYHLTESIEEGGKQR